MDVKWYLSRRLGWAVFILWFVMTITFLVFAWAPDYNAASVMWGQDPDAANSALEAYREQMRYDEPLLSRYVHWMVSFATLDLGTSFVQQESVRSILARTTPVTLFYLLPSIALSLVVGVAMGLYSTVGESRAVKWVQNVFVYSGLALPAFFAGEAVVFLAAEELGPVPQFTTEYAWFSVHNLYAMALPIAVMTLNLTAVQARYTRAETGEYVVADFVKTLRASGGGKVTIAKHVLRNAIVPLLSLFFTRTLTILLLSMYVIETVFNLPGLGDLTLVAIRQRDVAVILAITFLTVSVGVFGNLLQDFAYATFDPRIGSES